MLHALDMAAHGEGGLAPRMRAWLGALARSAAAVAAIEMALIAPVLVFLAVGMVDFGLGFYTKMMVDNAADAGAAYALRNAPSYAAASASTFNASVQSAAQAAVTISTRLSSGTLTASASEEFCCVGMTNCNPTTAPACANGLTAGTFVLVATSAPYTTFLPFQYASGLFNVAIANPVTFITVSTVRIQ
jgi:Flp pilus assembly protein TadG